MRRGLQGDGGTTYAGLPADDDAVPIEDTLGALDRLVQEGKIRHVGLSNETAWGVSRFLHLAETGRGPRVASIQNVYSPGRRSRSSRPRDGRVQV